MSSPTKTPTHPPLSSLLTPGLANVFEKQRDLLLQEITVGLDQVVHNLDVLNRSLHTLVQVGKEFDDVGRLWRSFYDGNQAKEHEN